MMQQRKLQRTARPPARALGRAGERGWARRPEIGQQIQRLRLARGWTRPQLADAARALGYDLGAQAVYQAETRGLARLSTIQVYAQTLGVEVAVLMEKPAVEVWRGLAQQIAALPRPEDDLGARVWDVAREALGLGGEP